jgi:hypothetical protein
LGGARGTPPYFDENVLKQKYCNYHDAYHDDRDAFRDDGGDLKGKIYIYASIIPFLPPNHKIKRKKLGYLHGQNLSIEIIYDYDYCETSKRQFDGHRMF